MGKKKNKLKAQAKAKNWAEAKKQMLRFLSLGLPKEEYKQELVKQNIPKDQHEEYIQEYEEFRKTHAMSKENAEYSKSLQDIIRVKKDNKLFVYYPLMEVVDHYQCNDVAFLVFKTALDFTYYDPETSKTKNFYRGMKDALNLQGIFSSGELVLGDHTTKEVFTKHTKFKQIEVEKVKTETKIIKQEVKSGIDKKKLDKAKQKTIHEMSKKWQKESVEEVLNKYLENVG